MERIFDAVYGYITLDPIEFKIVNSPIFQRLHWIKQLGPLNTIFPSAQHSRFSHSIGVYHIVRKMIKQLEESTGKKYSEFAKVDPKLLRLAALLHDIGHVPMSHIGERVLEEKVCAKGGDGKKVEAYGKDKQADWKSLFSDECKGSTTKLHEALSAEVVLHNQEIDRVLRSEDDGWPDQQEREIQKKRIARIIVGKDSTDISTLLLHSELDADRLDYLLRDSFFTGVEYGKIDLDYIISRLALVTMPDSRIPQLCVENKGLHTVEHYILGRFFLQTQIVWNRKVRLMDLLYKNVMGYMVGKSNDWGLMDLRKLLKHIRYNRKDFRKHLHAVYAFTDAQVFSKMRKLHEALDKKEKAKSADEEELYVNECVKTIMDGQVSEPVVGPHQRLVDLGTKGGEEFKKTVNKEANEIADRVCKRLRLFRKRVMVNTVSEEVMKYKLRMKDDEESNREAVRITYRGADGRNEKMAVSESSASILKGLDDKALVSFNVYYLGERRENEAELKKNREAIQEAYQKFVKKHFQAKTAGCGCKNGRHMCQIVREPKGLKRIKEFVKKPGFICQKCGRVSSDKKYLCQGVGI